MFRSVPKLLGFLLLLLGVAALFPVSKDATAQFINGNHTIDPTLPPVFDKGFRPGFGKGPVRSSPYRPAGQYVLGNQGGQQGQQGQFGQGGIGGGQFGGGQQGIGGGQFGQGGIGGGIQGGGIGGIQGGTQGVIGGGIAGGIISFGGVSGTPPFAIQTMPQIGGFNYLGAQGGVFGLTGGQQQGGALGQLGQLGQGGGFGGGIQGGFGGGIQGGFGGGIQGGFGGGAIQGGIQGAFGGQAGFVGKNFGAAGGSGY